MSAKKNKNVARRYLEEIWNQEMLEVEEEIFAQDYVYHDPSSPDLKGIAAHKQFVKLYRSAFPDLHFVLDDLVGEDDKVVSRWTCTGTHKGNLMGIPATGVIVTNVGMNFMRFEEGKIVEEWSNWSTLSFFQQLGVIPPLGG